MVPGQQQNKPFDVIYLFIMKRLERIGFSRIVLVVWDKSDVRERSIRLLNGRYVKTQSGVFKGI